ncbi:hypothetical protein EDB81DRAFT_775671 [Dactylonectria macrodidyma]|uniref:Uncharacterized protein n=1 Tax=Dactylonectria macrodidyma TaxID=307937 RepID=A0A9P9JLF9_9HYPO|nr:hypothetical protein EDB81DRAFT_775671 [Dactylonectria macrodidyma]
MLIHPSMSFLYPAFVLAMVLSIAPPIPSVFFTTMAEKGRNRVASSHSLWFSYFDCQLFGLCSIAEVQFERHSK